MISLYDDTNHSTETKCPKCANTILLEMLFCGNCGYQLVNKCWKCGNTNFSNIKYCTSCGVDLHSSQSGNARNSQMKTASPAIRLAGFIVDFLVAVACFGIFAFVFDVVLKLTETVSDYILGFIFFATLYIIVNYRLLSRKRQTIGKYVTKTHIVNTDESVPSLLRLIILRYILIWIPYVVMYGLAYFGQYNIFNGILILVIILLTLANFVLINVGDRRCVHDFIAGTKVVQV